MGNGQAVRHWVLVPGSGVRIPLPQPYLSIIQKTTRDSTKVSLINAQQVDSGVRSVRI
jgi:hypothetical protein